MREDDPTFLLTRLGDSFSGSSMSILVKDYLRLAELDRAGACHLLRHAMATGMHDNGADVRWIQSMLGHARLSTTEIYTRVSIEKLKEVHRRTHPSGDCGGSGSSETS
ncbi:MAG: tyrosine-type recombinase/integrase [Pirellulales bacterium]